MFGQKKKLIVNKKDIDQAILDKNRSLKRFNQKLAVEITSKESEMKDRQKEIKAAQDIYSKEDKAVKAISKEILRLNSTLAPIQKERTILSNDISVLKKEIGSYESDKAILLKDTSDLDIKWKATFDNLKAAQEELTIYESSKDDVVAVKKELITAKGSLESIKGQYKNAEDQLNIRVNNHHAVIKDLKKKEDDLVSSFKVNEKEFADKKAAIDNRAKELSKQDTELSSQVNGLKSLIQQQEAEYNSLSSACDEKQDDIKRAEFQADKIIQEAKDSAKETREKFKEWKISVLAQVAKLQLKGKIDTIDKAGLAEILNG